MSSDTTVSVAGAGRDRLREPQDERFAETVRRACEDALSYRKAFDGASVSRVETSGADDVERFPFATTANFPDRCPGRLSMVDLVPYGTLSRSDGAGAQRVFDARTDT